MKRLCYLSFSVISLIVSLILITGCTDTGSQFTSRIEVLSSGWKMQPVDKMINIDEPSLSLNDLNTDSWYEAVVPGTVMGSLASKKVVDDPYFGINMQK